MSYRNEDEEGKERPAQAGSLPSPSQPRDWDAILQHYQKNRGPYHLVAGIIVVLAAASVYFATRTLNVIPTSSAAQPLNVTVSPGAHPGQPPNTTPLPGAVPTDSYGNPIPGNDTTGGITAPPQGVDPVEWQGYLAWRRRCPNGQCSGNPQATSQQPQLTPAQQRAEEQRKKLEDLMWNARNSRPDAGIRKAGAEQTAAQPTTQKPAADEMSKSVEQQRSDPPETTRKNTCGPAKGPEYRLVGGISMIKARLLNAITGDAKGPIIAQVVKPTYNFDMTRVLIPKGAYLTGGYDRVLELDQERVLLSVNAITMPDGCQVKFEDVDILDQSGMAGLRDRVNHHYASLFLTSIATAAVGAGAQFGGGSGGYGYSPVDAARIGFGVGASQAAQQTFSRWANRRPTITIRAGQEIVIFPPADIPLGAWGDHHVLVPI